MISFPYKDSIQTHVFHRLTLLHELLRSQSSHIHTTLVQKKMGAPHSAPILPQKSVSVWRSTLRSVDATRVYSNLDRTFGVSEAQLTSGANDRVRTYGGMDVLVTESASAPSEQAYNYSSNSH